MSPVRVVLRQRAREDVENALDWYRDNADDGTALRFVAALEQAAGHLAAHPGSGSPRYAVELELPGLRSWPLEGFPYVLFYVEREAHVDVWRVLHGRRDVPAWLTGLDPDGGGSLSD